MSVLNLEREIERILKNTNDYDRFITDDDFSKTYRLNDSDLVLTKRKEAITVNFLDYSFEFKLLQYSEWYPVQVVKGQEIISIVINYENGRAHSALSWHRFKDFAEEIAQMITGVDAEIAEYGPRQQMDETAFKQLSLW